MKIYGLSFEEGGMSIGFELEGEVKDQGRLVQTRTLNLANSGANADAIEELKYTIIEFVEDALERFKDADVFSPDDEDDSDSEELGMGF